MPDRLDAPSPAKRRKTRPEFQASGPKRTGEHGLHQRHSPSTSKPRLKERALALLPLRRRLPIWSHREALCRSLQNSKDVLLIVGETGSGKSTQLPQFLIEQPWCKPRNVVLSRNGVEQTAQVGGVIAITEPRRVAATSLARRVAEEMGTPLGSSSPASRVGYSVRFDISISPSTQVKFLTEGMLLQELLADPWLKQYSAVVVDEVHERSTNVDLILGLLRNLVTGKLEGRGGISLKVVVMSATADMEKLVNFFEDGFKSPDAESTLISDETKIDQPKCLESNSQIFGHTRMSVHHIEGRLYPVEIIHSPEPIVDWVDEALNTILRIHRTEPLPG